MSSVQDRFGWTWSRVGGPGVVWEGDWEWSLEVGFEIMDHSEE